MREEFFLNVPESKKLIAKAVLAQEDVQKALAKGTLILHPSSTTYFVLKELGEEIPEGNEGLWVCGQVQKNGLCVSKAMVDLVLGNYKSRSQAHGGQAYPFDYIFINGKIQETQPLGPVLKQMGPGDVYVKAVNAIDIEGNLGVLLAVPAGGSVGHVVRSRAKQGFKLVVPTGLEKLIPTPMKKASELSTDFDDAMGIRSALAIIKADVFISEIEAFKLLTGCVATPIACGGINGVEGGYVFSVEGTPEQMASTRKLVDSVLGAELPKLPVYECSECPLPICKKSPKYSKEASDETYHKPLLKDPILA